LQTFYPDFTESVDVPVIPIAPLPIHHSDDGRTTTKYSPRPPETTAERRSCPAAEFRLHRRTGAKKRDRFTGRIQ
jgi:hypothetical protein